MTEREQFMKWCAAGHWKTTESMWAAWEARSRLPEVTGVETVPTDGITRQLRHVDSGTVYVVMREDGYEMWLYKDGWKLIDPSLDSGSPQPQPDKEA